jgi:hypothetical protein
VASPIDVDRYVARIRAFDGERYAIATETTVADRPRPWTSLAAVAKRIA